MFKLIRKLLLIALIIVAAFLTISITSGGNKFRWLGDMVQKTAEEAGETADLIKESSENVKKTATETVKSIRKTGEKIKETSEKVSDGIKETGGKLRDTADGIKNTTDKIAGTLNDAGEPAQEEPSPDDKDN